MLGRPRAGKMVACVQCGKEVYRHPSTVNRTLCSHSCRDAATKAKRVKDGAARCAKCREWKPIANFVKGVGGRPHSYCKPCSAAWFAARRGVAPEDRKRYRPAFKLTDEQRRQNKRDSNRRQHMARRAAGKKPDKLDIGKILCLQDMRCAYCGQAISDSYHIDHKDPVSRGGTNDPSNLQATCPKCNMAKGAMTDEEFLTCKRRPVVDWK